MSDALKLCKHCGHIKLEHISITTNSGVVRSCCLKSGCSACPGFERDPEPEVKPTMFSVRIDKTEAGYKFKVEPMPWCLELIALDSTPGVIAFVEAPNPGAACQRAWEKGQRELASLGGLPPSTPEQLLELLGDKNDES